MQKLKVKKAIVSKQGEKSSNYMQFLKIAKKKNVKIVVVQAGDVIAIDEKCSLSILFPEKDLIHTNILNNNSIVAKFMYQQETAKQFSLLLTGDVEEIAEKRLTKIYEDTDNLQADILKVAHHRFKNIFYNTVFRIGKAKDCTSWSWREKYFWTSK